MKIYTKTGDQGETGLLGGVRVSKSHLCIEICGALDELNAIIGVVLGTGVDEQVAKCLGETQHDLFDLGGSVAAAMSDTRRASHLEVSRTEKLEKRIDELDSQLEPMTAFVMPGGGRAGSQLHWARTVCRRVERRFVSLIDMDTERDFSQGLVFLNRLSDYLFVAARFVNAGEGHSETKWIPRTEPQ